MSDIKKYEPLWGTWYIESLIGEGSFGKVYKIRREEFGKTYYSAVKVISIPHDQGEIRRMKSEGLDDTSMHGYFQAVVKDIINEIDLMNEFRGNSHIVSFEDHKVIEKTDGIGWDILIRMELLSNLPDYVAQKPLTQSEVIKLGIHICRALELCMLKNTIHRDIKPDNIFISQYGEYKLGDFGIARQIERTMSGLSKKGTYSSMSPEVFKGEKYGASVDTYALGIVMYTLLNRNRPPFLPDYPRPIMPDDRDNALQKRVSGEAIPAIKGVDPELNRIMLKACAYKREDRFDNPTEMREALEVLAGIKSYALGMTANLNNNPSLTPTPQMPEAAGQTVHLVPDLSANTAYGTQIIPDLISAQEEIPLPPVLQTGDEAEPKQAHSLHDDTAGKKKKPKPVKLPKSKRKIPLIAAFSTLALLTLIGIVLLVLSGSHSNMIAQGVTGYGISINGQTDIVLQGEEEAKAVLDELAEHYINIANMANNTVSSVDYDEDVEVIEIKDNTLAIKDKQEALNDLIKGKAQSIEHSATQGETIQGIAQQYNISEEAILAENEGLTGETQLTEGTQIRLTLIQPYLHVLVHGTVEITEDIEFETETKKDANLFLDNNKIEQEGAKGSKNVTYTYIIKNGVIISETVLYESVIKEPVNKIVLEGTKPLVCDFSGKGITNEKLASMVQSGEIPKNVTNLYLINNNISDITPLKSLTGLTELHLDMNDIKDITSLKALKKLIFLDISINNNIEDYNPLKSLVNLKELHLPYGLSDEILNDIQTALPKCKIVRLR